MRASLRIKDDHLAKALSGDEFLVFDGAMGTMLQQRGLVAGELPELMCLENPEVVSDVHRAYVEAGSQVVTTNTFGANALKLAGVATVSEVFDAAVKCAREAGARYVAADMGPTGQLMAPLGDLSFSHAYELFAEQARAAEQAQADLVIIETMADVLEATAAAMAALDCFTGPVFATMTFTAAGRTFLGTSPTDAALALAIVGVDALGVNCSAGPADLQPVVSAMLGVAPCPVIVQANAGLPEVVDGTTAYSMSPDEYARAVTPMMEEGASIIGGCCGTNPDFMRAVVNLTQSKATNFRPASQEDVMKGASCAAEGGGRDADVIDIMIASANRAEMRRSLADEYDEG